MLPALASPTYRRTLDDGLVLRWSTAADTDRLAELMAMTWRPSADAPPNVREIEETRLMMRGDSPMMGPGDCALVEDTSQPGNPIVCCTYLWRQTWAYEGVAFGVGRPENVATSVGYRGRGLVRAVFDLVHARSAAEGHLVQAITGIPYYYRRLGYDYALDLHGARLTYLSLIPPSPAEAPEPYGLRPAVAEDIPAIGALYERGYTGGAVWAVVPEGYWRYHIGLWNEPAFRDMVPTVSALRWRPYMVVRATGEAVGYAILGTKRWGPEVGIHALEIGAQASLSAMMPSLLRALAAYAAGVPTVSQDVEPLRAIAFELGRAHPVYDVLGDVLAPRVRQPYAWYVRVPDVAAFLRHVTGVLERRLAVSSMAGYTGNLEIDFYEGGVQLVFEEGRLAGVEPWQPPQYNRSYAVGFPPLVFPQLLLGHRSLDELRDAYPDVIARGEAETLLKALFPARHSRVMPL